MGSREVVPQNRSHNRVKPFRMCRHLDSVHGRRFFELGRKLVQDFRSVADCTYDLRNSLVVSKFHHAAIVHAIASTAPHTSMFILNLTTCHCSLGVCPWKSVPRCFFPQHCTDRLYGANTAVMRRRIQKCACLASMSLSVKPPVWSCMHPRHLLAVGNSTTIPLFQQRGS